MLPGAATAAAPMALKPGTGPMPASGGSPRKLTCNPATNPRSWRMVMSFFSGSLCHSVIVSDAFSSSDVISPSCTASAATGPQNVFAPLQICQADDDVDAEVT